MLKKVIIERQENGLWDVTREREKNGERCTGCKTLEDAFNYVRKIYDENGEDKEDFTKKKDK